MVPMRLADVAGIVGAALPAGADPDLRVGPDIQFDSRLITPGALFLALKGDHADGHDFLTAAAANGAAAALVAETRPARLAQLEVADPLVAVARLAGAVLEAERDHLTVIGLTGSTGKTTTKDLLAQVCAAAGETVAPENSFNNEIGVPLTAARVGPETRYLVCELGAYAPGDIAYLAGLVRPQVGVVLNIGPAHALTFGSPEDTARAKGELIDALPDDGWAVLNADDRLVAPMALRHPGPVLWFSAAGEPGQAGDSVWATGIAADDRMRHSFTLHARPARPQGLPVTLQVPGRHQVANALAAAGAALAAGIGLDTVAAALSRAAFVSHWRLEITERPDGLMVVNDAYNANPDSMRSTLETVAGLYRARLKAHPDAQLAAFLGDMLELGDQSPQLHAEVGRQAKAAGVTRLIVMGQYAADIARGAAGVAAETVNSKAEAVSRLKNLAPADMVLIKASRGIGLETVAKDLTDAEDSPC